MTMKIPPHPGLLVRRDCINSHNLTIGQAAKMLGVSRQQLSGVANGRVNISPAMAVRIEMAFGGSAEAWCRLQADYNLARALDKVGKIKVERARKKVGKIKVERARKKVGKIKVKRATR